MVSEVATRSAQSFGKKMTTIQCVSVSLIDDEHAGDLVQAVCVGSSSDYTPVMAPAMKAKKVAT